MSKQQTCILLLNMMSCVYFLYIVYLYICIKGMHTFTWVLSTLVQPSYQPEGRRYTRIYMHIYMKVLVPTHFKAQFLHEFFGVCLELRE